MSRTEYRTSTGQKRLLKRDSKGRIVDNQSWKNVIRADLAKRSKIERARKLVSQIEVLLKRAKVELK